MQAVSAFCESQEIKDVDNFMYLCFKQGFDIKRYGLLGKTLNDGEKDLKTGIVVEPTTNEIAKGIETLYELGENHFIPNIIEEKKKYSWAQMTEKFLALYQQL